MKPLHLFLFAAAAALTLSCTDRADHFITDQSYRRTVHIDFRERCDILAGDTASLGLFDRNMSTREREALEFLYAYSPLGDITLKGGDYFYRNVRQTFLAREKLPWGDSIPEYIFRHYVMPLRVNNEALDDSRTAFFDSLYPIVSGMTMEQAALEVNHWCHRYVNYQPTDGRTAPPSALLKRTYGRCGEETVFAASALRAVGIPARQVYTPRWAHCDDNHAWLEVWVDGKWHYMGACEPAPKLDEAWFTYPASRGLYMEVRVFGNYFGEEDIVSQEPLVARINSTANYAPVSRPTVRVTDAAGAAAAGADVFYKVYNYAEYYTVFSQRTDKNGECRFTMGRGDWIVSAYDPTTSRDGMVEANPGDTSVITVVLDRAPGDEFSSRFEIAPPRGTPVLIDMKSPEEQANTARGLQEDAVREAYAASFPKNCSESMSRFYASRGAGSAGRPSLLSDRGLFKPENLDRAVKISRGNWEMIPRLLDAAAAAGPSALTAAAALLNVLVDKDLQDADPEVLLSHLLWYDSLATSPDLAPDFAARYIVMPRIGTEWLTPWRGEVSRWIEKNGITSADSLASAVGRIPVDNTTTRGDVFVTPEGVARIGLCDGVSRDMFFVAAARTLAIPSRLSPVDGKPQVYGDGEWNDVVLPRPAAGPGIPPAAGPAPEAGEAETGYGLLTLVCDGGAVADPLYYVNFTVSRLERGRMKLLDLGESSEGDMGDNMRCSRIFSSPVRLAAGNYFLVTGNRRADGSVVSTVTAFDIEKDGSRTLNFKIEDVGSKPVGTVPADLAARLFGGEGYSTAVLLSSADEPSKHLLNDFASLKRDFDAVKAPFGFYYPDAESAAAADRTLLPATAVCRTDDGGKLFEAVTAALALQKEYPVVLVGNGKGEVVYASSGYDINQGVRILGCL